jgi:hypothetical protein
MTKAERSLESIIKQAETLRPASETEDEQMYYLIGGIIANAEDALGAIWAGRNAARFASLLDALANGNVHFHGVKVK